MEVFDDEDDAMDLFDAPGDTKRPRVAALAPRAHEHPHFRLSHWIWPAGAAEAEPGSALDEASRALTSFMAEEQGQG